MSKIIKQDRVVRTDKVFVVPDGIAPAADGLEEEADALADRTDALEEADMSEEKDALPVKDQKQYIDEISRKILQSAGAEREKLLDQAREDAEHIREQAKQEGYREAFGEMKARVEQCLTGVNELLDRLQSQQAEYFAQYERQLSLLAVDIAEKTLNKSVGEHEDEMKSLIAQAVSSIRNVDWISVEVSDRLPGLVRWLESELGAQNGARRCEVNARDLPPGACVIYTPEGVVDASVSVQLENLRNLFSRMNEGETI